MNPVLRVYRYDIVFRQSVGAEDIFMGMGGKSPATASCRYQLVSLPARCW